MKALWHALKKLLPERIVLMRAPMITCSIKVLRADGTIEDGPVVTNIRDFIQADML